MALPHDADTDAPPGDPESFAMDGQILLDAYHFGRAANAVLSACQTDGPVVQLEIFDDEGVLVVGTDRRDLLRAWVPVPSDEGWLVTAEIAGPPPGIDEKPSRIVSAAVTRLGLKLLAELGSARRAKENARELVAVQWGRRLEDYQPKLGQEDDPRAVRFRAEDGIAIAADPLEPFDWRPVAKLIEHRDAAVVDYGVGLSGARAIQYGRIAQALGADRRLVACQAVPADGGGQSYVVVSVQGFPQVRGFGIDS